jgi:hypothetical protein
MFNAPRPPTENQILAALPPEDYERIAPHLTTVVLSHRQVLYQAGQQIEHVYFPLNSMVSLISQMDGGPSVEVGVTGYEGMVGISALLGVDRSLFKSDSADSGRREANERGSG